MEDKKAPKDLRQEIAAEISKVFEHFAPGGKFGPIEDPKEYEELTASLPPLQRELNREITNFIQLVDYFEREKIKLTPDVADAMFSAAKLPVEERIGRVREINQMLMKRLDHVGKGAAFRM